MSKILIIEDDKDIAELVEFNLKQENFRVQTASNGSKGLAKAKESKPDLIILDLMLPDMGGFDICKALKADESTKKIPVLILTAKSEEIDRIVGFEVGADDYLTKPFSPRELVLRIKAVLRRSQKESQNEPDEEMMFDQLRIIPEKHQILVGKEEVKLTAIEFKLLVHLFKNRGRVSSRDNLLDKVWGYDTALTTRTVDTHIKRLRQKLGLAGDYIETVRGVGYRFVEKI